MCRRNCTQAFSALGLIGLLLTFALPASSAQREYVLGTSVNFSTGARNQPPGSVSPPSANSWPSFYSLYPSLSLSSARGRSSLNANYAFGFNHTSGNSATQTQSHTGSLNYSRALGPRWNVAVSDSFTMTGDPGTFNSLRGVASPEGVSTLFSPVAVGASTRSNSINTSLAWTLDSTSNISFTAAHTLTNHGGSDALFSTALSNQQQFSGSVAYSQTLGARDSWNFSYKGSYFDSKNFEDSTSQAVRIGYSMQVLRDLTLQINAGVSGVNSKGSAGGYLGYDTSASLAKTIQSNSFSLSYTQDSVQPTGLGSTSETRRGALGWNRAFGKKMTTFADVSVYRSHGTLDNALNTRGVMAAANVGFPVTEKLSVSAGATLQRSSGTGTFDFVQKSLFLSLSYSEPNLKSFR